LPFCRTARRAFIGRKAVWDSATNVKCRSPADRRHIACPSRGDTKTGAGAKCAVRIMTGCFCAGHNGCRRRGGCLPQGALDQAANRRTARAANSTKESLRARFSPFPLGRLNRKRILLRHCSPNKGEARRPVSGDHCHLRRGLPSSVFVCVLWRLRVSTTSPSDVLAALEQSGRLSILRCPAGPTSGRGRMNEESGVVTGSRPPVLGLIAFRRIQPALPSDCQNSSLRCARRRHLPRSRRASHRLE